MADTVLKVNPTSYQFTNLEEATTINIETNAPYVNFVRKNTYGTGSAVFESGSNILTSKSFGKGQYEFNATAEGGAEVVVPFNLEVARPLLGKQTQDQVYVDMYGYGSTWNYAAPEGYRLKLLDAQVLEEPLCEISVEDTGVIITPNKTGSGVYDVVVEKINPADNEIGMEYKVGTVTIDVFEVVIEPNTNYISTKINKTETIDTFKCILGSNGKGARLTFDVTESEPDILQFNSTETNNTTDGYVYAFTIKALKPGEAKINVSYNGDKVYELNVLIEDIKTLTYSPEAKSITLPYNSTYTITKIQYDNNDVYDLVEIVNSNNKIIQTNLIKVDDTNNIYTLTIKNIATAGGNATVTVKSINTTEQQVIFSVKCYKQVKNGVVTLDPPASTVIVHEQQSYEYNYISVTNADKVEVESTDVSIAEARLEDLTTIPTEPNGDGDQIPINFPAGSIQKKLFILGKMAGKCDIAIKGIVNENDVSSTSIIKVTVLASDELPDYSRLVNLETDKISRSRQGDIVINFPADNSVLVLKEKMLRSVAVEFGYTFDYVENTNPTKTINPVKYSESTGKPVWLNYTTNEVFTCIDETLNDNRWKGSKGTTINYIEPYPNPGEKGFGVGPAPEGLAERYNLTPLPGTFDKNSDQYGNYIDKSNTVYVFIPKHYIIPKADPNLIGIFPYDGLTYEFSWEAQDGKFNDNHIPRCFINNGKVQPGIFVSKYNSNTFQEYYKEDSYTTANVNKITSTAGIHSTPPVMMTSVTTTKKWSITIPDTKLYPEIYLMAKTLIPSGGNRNDLGKHNMSIFIQTMIANLGDLHTIASYEKSAREDVCYKLGRLVSGTWVREVKNINTGNNETQKMNPDKIFYTGDSTTATETIHFNSDSGSIRYEYNRLFSHNGQFCGVYDVGGPINTPLPGILVVQEDVLTPNSYKVYGLKKDVDITKIERDTFNSAKDTNTSSIIYRTPLFDLANYDLLAEITNNEEVCKMLYMNINTPYSTHLDSNSLLEGSVEQYNSLNAGLNIGSLTGFTAGDYLTTYTPVVDRAMRTSKFKNSVFNMGFLSKKTEMTDIPQVWYGMFTANYAPNVEEARVGGFNINGIYNGYRSRVLKHIGSLQYFSKPNSEYLFGIRPCITPDDTHTNSDA